MRGSRLARARRLRAPVALALTLALGAAACSTGGSGTAAEPTPGITTLEPLPAPPGGPPAGRLVADLRQSSRDVALDRFQVWVGNGLTADLLPRALVYRDPRFRRPLPGGRLRPAPSGSERGYTLPLPPDPVCGQRPADARPGRLSVTTREGTRTLRVADEAEVVARYVAQRCLERAVARVARVTWAHRVEVDRSTSPPAATVRLRVTPTGSPGAVRLGAVTGTPVLTSAPGDAWTFDEVVRGRSVPLALPLRVVPARCDPHVFAESAGATTFRVRVSVGNRTGDLLLPLPPAAAADALGFAADACGL